MRPVVLRHECIPTKVSTEKKWWDVLEVGAWDVPQSGMLQRGDPKCFVNPLSQVKKEQHRTR